MSESSPPENGATEQVPAHAAWMAVDTTVSAGQHDFVFSCVGGPNLFLSIAAGDWLLLFDPAQS
ncbi:hypothetical protein ILS50_28545, partial [Klebsiella pneumoniae]